MFFGLQNFRARERKNDPAHSINKDISQFINRIGFGFSILSSLASNALCFGSVQSLMVSILICYLRIEDFFYRFTESSLTSFGASFSEQHGSRVLVILLSRFQDFLLSAKRLIYGFSKTKKDQCSVFAISLKKKKGFVFKIRRETNFTMVSFSPFFFSK